LGAGRSGSINSHNSSFRIGLAIGVPPCTTECLTSDWISA
jgi:hypothetical protein